MNELTIEALREDRPEGGTNEMTRSETENPEDSSTGRPARPAGSAGSRGARGRFKAQLSEADRFWSKVAHTPADQAGCWEWRGRFSADGYPLFDRSDGTVVRAHRYAWELAHGPLAPELTLDHLIGPDGPCTSGPPCIRAVAGPDGPHLEPVTTNENLRRRHARARARAAREGR